MYILWLHLNKNHNFSILDPSCRLNLNSSGTLTVVSEPESCFRWKHGKMFLKLFRNEAILKEGVATQIHAISSLASKLPVTNKKKKYGDKTPKIQHFEPAKIIVSKVEISSFPRGEKPPFSDCSYSMFGDIKHSGNCEALSRWNQPRTFAAQPWRALRFHRLPSVGIQGGRLGVAYRVLQGSADVFLDVYQILYTPQNKPLEKWWCFETT